MAERIELSKLTQEEKEKTENKKVVLVILGWPGSGKKYVADVLGKISDFHIYIADEDVPKELAEVLRQGLQPPESLREVFYDKILKRSEELATQYDKLAVVYWMPRNKTRQQFVEKFPQTRFLLVETEHDTWVRRVMARTNHVNPPENTLRSAKAFDPLEVPHFVIDNSSGEKELVAQLKTLLSII